MTIEKKDNHVEEALANLLSQFKNKETFAKVLTSYIAQVQDLEDAAFEVYFGRMIDNAVGVQLDGIGTIVGEERNGKDDDAYRTALRVRILINLSEGTPEDIIAILATLTGGTIKIREYYPAAYIAELTDTITPGSFDAALIAIYMRQGTCAGVKAHFVYYPEDAFRYDSGPGYDQGHYGGAS